MNAERIRQCAVFRCLQFVLLLSAAVATAGARPQLGERRNLEVNVRLATGAQLPEPVEVVAFSPALSVRFRGTTDAAGQVLFGEVLPGYYTIEINADGYERLNEEVSVDESNPVTKVYINLRPLGMKPVAATPASAAPVLPQKARKEVEKAQQALRAKNYPESEKYITRALKIAPSHPFVNYMAGLLYFRLDKLDLAQTHLEKATLLNSSHAPSFGLLGTVLYRKGKYAGAIAALERALVLDPNPWETHWAIANAYFQEKRFEKARAHAERARQLSGGKAPDTGLILGVSLAYLGEKEQAMTELENYLANGGDRPGAGQARKMLAQLRAPAAEHTTTPAEAAAPTPIANVDVPVLVGLSENWAPPDVDASKPPVDPNVACSLPSVLQPTAANTAALLKNLEKIGARESIELYEFDPLGNTQLQRLENFDYVVGIREAAQRRQFFIEESRRALSMAESTVARYYTQGIPALALVFHPYYVDDFEITCEGLGQWRGEPTWMLHFQQRDAKPSRLHGYQIRDSFYPVPLKGRAWIGANSYQVLRIETDLVKPIEEIALKQEHMSIEYKPVHFQKQKMDLWLPETAEVHSFRGKRRLRLRHVFTDFMLFLVDMKQDIKDPKNVPPQQPE